MVTPHNKRRFIERRFFTSDARKLFNLGNDEMFLNVHYDKVNNKIVVESVKDFDMKKGDK